MDASAFRMRRLPRTSTAPSIMQLACLKLHNCCHVYAQLVISLRNRRLCAAFCPLLCRLGDDVEIACLERTLEPLHLLQRSSVRDSEFDLLHL